MTDYRYDTFFGQIVGTAAAVAALWKMLVKEEQFG